MNRGRTAKVLTTKIDGDLVARRPDQLIVEEPLSILLDDHLVTTTMRTPGHDFELAVGFAFTEGLLGDATVKACRYCAIGPAVETEFNVVSVDTGGAAPKPVARLATTTSSCGLCGSALIDTQCARLTPLLEGATFDPAMLATIPDRMRREQTLYLATGAVHAAGAFDRDGGPVVVREDVSRHNAVDKVVGRLLLDDALPANRLGLYVSGRSSFEIVQKAWAAGFSAVVAVSAPTALAVETARRAGLMLAGFAREGRVNIYAPERLGSWP